MTKVPDDPYRKECRRFDHLKTLPLALAKNIEDMAREISSSRRLKQLWPHKRWYRPPLKYILCVQPCGDKAQKTYRANHTMNCILQKMPIARVK